MKRVIRGGTNVRETIFEDENFDFVRTHGIGMQDTPWTGLAVVTKPGSLAKKHVVEIRLNSIGNPDFNGEPVNYQYKDAYVAHGMRGEADTLDDTAEYIDVLEDALDFAYRVNNWIFDNYDIDNDEIDPLAGFDE